MIKICTLSFSPVFKNSPLKSLQWFNSYFWTNSGNASITARTTGSPSQCTNPPWVHSPCVDCIWPLQNWGAEVLSHPYWSVLSPFNFCPLFCGDPRSEEPGKQLWYYFCGKMLLRDTQRHSWALLLWCQLLAEERFLSGLALGASSCTFLANQCCPRSVPPQEMNMGHFV